MVLRITRDYDQPVIEITENGCAYHDRPDHEGEVNDDRRIAFYRGYLGALHEAIRRGADVRSYHAWSLLDNFEWAEGYGQRFGLTWVDFETGGRIPKGVGALVWGRRGAERGSRRSRPARSGRSVPIGLWRLEAPSWMLPPAMPLRARHHAPSPPRTPDRRAGDRGSRPLRLLGLATALVLGGSAMGCAVPPPASADARLRPAIRPGRDHHPRAAQGPPSTRCRPATCRKKCSSGARPRRPTSPPPPGPRSRSSAAASSPTRGR